MITSTCHIFVKITPSCCEFLPARRSFQVRPAVSFAVRMYDACVCVASSVVVGVGGRAGGRAGVFFLLFVCFVFKSAVLFLFSINPFRIPVPFGGQGSEKSK